VLLPLQCALEKIRNGIQRGMVVIRRTPAFEPHMLRTGDMLFQDLHQPGFPNAAFTTQ
jgi:hypothetical protein